MRIITDIVCVLTGIALFLLAGGSPSKITTVAGLGSVITAFFMGPVIEFFCVHVARPMVKEE